MFEDAATEEHLYQSLSTILQSSQAAGDACIREGWLLHLFSEDNYSKPKIEDEHCIWERCYALLTFSGIVLYDAEDCKSCQKRLSIASAKLALADPVGMFTCWDLSFLNVMTFVCLRRSEHCKASEVEASVSAHAFDREQRVSLGSRNVGSK